MLNTLRPFTHIIAGGRGMASGIFVSNRRGDSQHAAGWCVDCRYDPRDAPFPRQGKR
jgi:hypothetical protein